MNSKTNPRKLRSRYFERSLRFPVSLSFLLIFMGVLAERIYNTGRFQTLSLSQWIFLGSGFAVLIILEIIESLVYPKRLYFLLGMLLTGIRILALYVIIAADPTGITSVLVGFILFTLCFYMSPVLVLPLLIVYLYGYYLYLGLDFSTGQIQFGYLYEISSLILLYMLAVIIRWDDHVRRRNQFLVTQLEAYATNSISLGKQEERDRISRDLHDSLGHHLVSINIQLQKAVAYREIDAGESQNAVEQAQQATNQAIQELRQTIRDLREFEVEPHLEDEIQEIVDLVRQNGLSLEYSHSGTSAGFPELTLQALKQVVQEGLTNIQKHAQAKQAVLQIDYQRNWIRVLIQDDGVGFNPMKVNPADHYGLVGMRERLQIVGGKIRITSRPDTGTKLIIQLPKEIYG